MKKALVLTSIVALAACSGGGGHNGGHTPTQPAAPVVTIPGFSGGTTVNAANTDLTNMSSYTVDYSADENTSKQAMIDYVNTKLGGSRTSSNNNTRAASLHRAGRITRVDDTEFATADAAIAEMKQVMYSLIQQSNGADAVARYITRYKDAVARALLLAD